MMFPEFETYSVQLKERQDRWERLVKLSRDLTISSKRFIFALHRAASQPLNQRKETAERCASDALPKIKSLFQSIAKEVDQTSFWKYHRAFTPGCQEFAEGYSFYWWLTQGNLVGFDRLASVEVSAGCVSSEDWCLGVLDLTGELMRHAINCVSRGDNETCAEVCVFLQSVQRSMTAVVMSEGGRTIKDAKAKLEVLDASVAKVEQAVYRATIRRNELITLKASAILPPPPPSSSILNEDE